MDFLLDCFLAPFKFLAALAAFCGITMLVFGGLAWFLWFLDHL